MRFAAHVVLILGIAVTLSGVAAEPLNHLPP